ncbi:MAG: DUF6516 family protein [Bacteroidota bacterium]
MDFLKLLESKTFIEEWVILDNRVWETGLYYKIRVTLKDESLFQASEYKDIKERSYSFHWQDKEGKLIIRWDNAPHFKEIATFPHHKHFIDRVEESIEMTLENALNAMEKMLENE